MSATIKDWELCERWVARLIADQVSTDLCVTVNARVVGRITNRSRQLDVLIECGHDTDNSKRIIVDAKRRRRKIDVTHVEAFEGLVKDVDATHGLLVCPVGNTKAAESRARRGIAITLVPLMHLCHFDPSLWDRCQRDGCDRGYVFWDGYPQLKAAGGHWAHSVGKCDRCRSFHVKCHRCGQLFWLPNEGDAQGQCKPPWFWLSSIERDEKGRPSAELHIMQADGRVITVDRGAL